MSILSNLGLNFFFVTGILMMN